jgi:uncharacterized protein with HEPN domain
MAADDRDAALLLDMLRYAEEATAVVHGLTFERYSVDRLRVLALERTIEIVGEAARHVSAGKKTSMPGIPWNEIHGQRNVLARMYGKIDHFQLFKTAREDLPQLIAILRKALA